MGTIWACIAAAAIGVDVGWQRLPEGGMEYIIQIEPQTLDALRAGQPIQSDIPAGVGDIRSYRIVVGSKKALPRDEAPTPPRKLTPDPAVKPLGNQPAAFVESNSTAPAAKSPAPGPAVTDPEKSPTPWLPLTFTLFGLFASLGGNFYLGWIAWEMRKRCCALLGSVDK